MKIGGAATLLSSVVLFSSINTSFAIARSCSEQAELCADHARKNAAISDALKQKGAKACLTTNRKACQNRCKREGGKAGNYFSGYLGAIGFPQYMQTYFIDDCR
jgi:hypothetical protein